MCLPFEERGRTPYGAQGCLRLDLFDLWFGTSAAAVDAEGGSKGRTSNVEAATQSNGRIKATTGQTETASDNSSSSRVKPR